MAEFNDNSPRDWNLFSLWRQLAQPVLEMSRVESVPGWGSSAALEALLSSVRTRLVGRAVKARVGAHQLGLTLTDVQATLTPTAASMGQAEDVRVSAEHLTWGRYEFASATATLNNVHSRLGLRPVLVAAPVDLRLTVPGGALNSLLAGRLAAADVQCRAGGVLSVRPACLPAWIHLEVRPHIEGYCLVLRPVRLVCGRGRSRLGRAVPGFRPKVALPDGIRITGVEVGDGHVEVTVRLDEWQVDYRDAMAKLSKWVPTE